MSVLGNMRRHATGNEMGEGKGRKGKENKRKGTL